MPNDVNLLKYLGITEYSLESVIKVGSILVRPKDLEMRLGYFANRLVNYTEDEIYQFQHFGTATGIKYRERYFVISTEHQRKLGAFGRLGIISDPEQAVITPSATWTVKAPQGVELEDSHDFAFYEYQSSKYPNGLPTHQFFEVGEESGVNESVGKIALTLGFPSRKQNIDYYSGKIDLLVVSGIVELVEETSSKHVFKFRTVSEGHFFEDGMSGAPVFEVVRNFGEFTIRWLGVVVRGGPNSRYGRVISADFIIKQIDKAVFGHL